MDRCYFIDKETFEVYEEHPKVFSCDPHIAEAVSILNKLGYYTLASCEGHYEIKEFDVSYPKEKMRTSIYILFQDQYKFPNIPEGFILEALEDKILIEHSINYFDKDIYIKRSEFEKEKSKYIYILNKWAKGLPERER